MNPIFGTDAERLQQLAMPQSVAELEALIAKHPYCQNLYYHLLEAHVLEKSSAPGEATLARIATYATDRRFLFDHLNHLLQVDTPEDPPMVEALELTEPTYEENIQIIKELESHAEEMTLEQLDPIGSNRPDSNMNYDSDEVEQINELLEGATYFEDEEGPSSFVEYISPEKLIPEDDNHAGLSFLEKIIDATSGPPTFFEWDQTILGAQMTALQVLHELSLNRANEVTSAQQTPINEDYPNIQDADSPHQSFDAKHSKRKKPFAKRLTTTKMSDAKQQDTTIPSSNVDTGAVEEIAQKSVMENNEIASETLAELLVAQEQYEKALRMYERLILIIPEKSSFFAEKIQYLRKIIAR